LADYDSLPGKSILITFDDSSKSIYQNAFPLLQEERIPAAIFLTTNYIGAAEVKGYDALKLLTRERPFPEVASLYRDLILGDNKELRDSYDDRILTSEAALRLHFRSALSSEKQIDIAHQLCERLNFVIDKTFASNLYLNWEEIHQMKEWFEFAAHTASHPLLSHLSRENQKYEILTSKQVLEEQLGRISWFAYPYGYPRSFSDTTIQLLQEYGFKGAFTTSPSHNILPIRNPYEINRFMIYDEDVYQLLEFIKV
jgi:peptidoglycan/xylan/chitin deacetylase (PgdA/CDA1 family)